MDATSCGAPEDERMSIRFICGKNSTAEICDVCVSPCEWNV